MFSTLGKQFSAGAFLCFREVHQSDTRSIISYEIDYEMRRTRKGTKKYLLLSYIFSILHLPLHFHKPVLSYISS
jgi:hypothetical protein